MGGIILRLLVNRGHKFNLPIFAASPHKGVSPLVGKLVPVAQVMGVRPLLEMAPESQFLKSLGTPPPGIYIGGREDILVPLHSAIPVNNGVIVECGHSMFPNEFEKMASSAIPVVVEAVFKEGYKMIEIEEILPTLKRLEEEPGAIATGLSLTKSGRRKLPKEELPKEGASVSKSRAPRRSDCLADFETSTLSPINALSVRCSGDWLIIPAISPLNLLSQLPSRRPIDLAFVYLVDFKKAKATQKYKSLLEKGDLIWVSKEKIASKEFVSKRMKFLATRD